MTKLQHFWMKLRECGRVLVGVVVAPGGLFSVIQNKRETNITIVENSRGWITRGGKAELTRYFHCFGEV